MGMEATGDDTDAGIVGSNGVAIGIVACDTRAAVDEDDISCDPDEDELLGNGLVDVENDEGDLMNVMERDCVEAGSDDVKAELSVGLAVETTPIVLVDVPTPSEVGRLDGMGIADVADASGVSNEPVMRVSLNINIY